MFKIDSSACVNRDGKPRRAYPDREAAEYGANEALWSYGNEMVPYRCDSCGAWHLCPATRHTPGHHCCYCSKQAYSSMEAAERRARILGDERGTQLRVYECPYGEGWHLTSRL
jgi:hypothetical protein